MISADPELRKLGLKVLRRELLATFKYYAPSWVQRVVEWAASWVEAPATVLWSYCFPPAPPSAAEASMALTAAPGVRVKDE